MTLRRAAGALLAATSTPTHGGSPGPGAGLAAPVAAEYRGCDTEGWCRFWIRSPDPPARSLLRVHPDGVARAPADEALAVAIRDRLNALLASMIHQHKRIVLHDLRALGDGTYAATVTVNEADLASDPTLVELREKANR